MSAPIGHLRSAALSLLPSPDDYREARRSWRTDLLAGITVGIVALPLALAFGVSSGAGAESGLVTAIIAGIVAAVFGGSNVQVSGPTGAMVVVLAPIIAAHGAGALALVCLMAGLIVLAAGALRLGRTVSYIPWPVIEGFTLGIAVIIFLQQVPTATGAGAPESTNAAVAAAQSLMAASWPEVGSSLLLVAIVVGVMLVSMRVHPRFPGSLLAIAIAAMVAALFGLPVETIGALPAGLPAPRARVRRGRAGRDRVAALRPRRCDDGRHRPVRRRPRTRRPGARVDRGRPLRRHARDRRHRPHRRRGTGRRAHARRRDHARSAAARRRARGVGRRIPHPAGGAGGCAHGHGVPHDRSANRAHDPAGVAG
jgi:hypothetical protein